MWLGLFFLLKPAMALSDQRGLPNGGLVNVRVQRVFQRG
jgi:hypothetical protein